MTARDDEVSPRWLRDNGWHDTEAQIFERQTYCGRLSVWANNSHGWYVSVNSSLPIWRLHLEKSWLLNLAETLDEKDGR